MEYTKLDIACGQNKTPGYTGIDISPCEGVDIVADLESYPWPVPDGSVHEATCNHYMEHVSDTNKFMDELHRVLKSPTKDEYGNLLPGGRCTIVVPYLRSDRAFQDPTHKQFISESRFLYYNKTWRENNRLDHYPIACDFDFQYSYSMSSEWTTRSEEARNFAIRHYWNVVNDLIVVVYKR